MKLLLVLLLLLGVNETSGCLPGFVYMNQTCLPCPTDPGGYYCHDGEAEICPSGYYCTSPAANPELCPKGNYCRAGSTFPNPCILPDLECKEAGLPKPKSVYLGVIVLALVLLLWLGVYIYLGSTQVCLQKQFIQHQKTLEGGPRRSSIDQLQLSIPRKVEIRFDNLNFFLPGRQVLTDVSGVFSPGQLTAIMGPSGCGKSTLLNLLSGRVTRGFVEGGIKINGEPVNSLFKYRQAIGFVPQDDIMYPDLTVEENLLYSRLLFSVEETDKAKNEKKDAWPIVYAAINTLGLQHIHDKTVGSPENRGVSGGERKRVSIGMEVVRTPAVLLLDEPTSGLDSSTAVQLAHTLKELASAGMTLVAVIHQPRYEIFSIFDRILLLNSHGKMVYSGPAAQAEPYFVGLGYPLPDRVNLADHILDIMAGLGRRSNGEGLSELRPGLDKKELDATNDHLAISWKETATEMQKWSPHYTGTLTKGGEILALKPPETAASNQFIYVSERLWVQSTRAYRTFLLDIFLIFSIGLVISSLFTDMDLITGELPAEMQALQLALALPGTVLGLRAFGSDREIYTREKFSGMNPVAYFGGKFLGHLVPTLLLPPLVFLAGFYFIMRPRGSVGDFYLVFLLTQWAVVGFAWFISLIVDKKNCSNVAFVCVLLFLMSNALSPRRSSLVANLSFFGEFLVNISYLRYSAEAIALAEFRANPPIFHDLIVQFLEPSDWYLWDWTFVLVALFVHGCVFRLLALFWLSCGDGIGKGIQSVADRVVVYYRSYQRSKLEANNTLEGETGTSEGEGDYIDKSRLEDKSMYNESKDGKFQERRLSQSSVLYPLNPPNLEGVRFDEEGVARDFSKENSESQPVDLELEGVPLKTPIPENAKESM